MLAQGRINPSNICKLDAWSKIKFNELAKSCLDSNLDSDQILRKFVEIELEG